MTDSPPSRPRLPNPLNAPESTDEVPSEGQSHTAKTPNKSRLPQFSMKMLLLIMTVFSAAMAGYGGMLTRKGDWFFSVLLCAATPALAMLVIGIVEYLRRRR